MSFFSTIDKLGGNSPNPKRLSSFHEMLNTYSLVDLECKCPKFTWRNNGFGGDFIMESIDMAFANFKWREAHNQALVMVETAIGSYHNPHFSLILPSLSTKLTKLENSTNLNPSRPLRRDTD